MKPCVFFSACSGNRPQPDQYLNRRTMAALLWWYRKINAGVTSYTRTDGKSWVIQLQGYTVTILMLKGV